MTKLQLKVTSRKAEKDILKEVGDLAVQFIKGESGPQGKQGEKGFTGERGIQGEKGFTGDKGERGIDGSKGEKGKDGDNGKDGAKGAKGEKGEAGKDGVTPKIEEVEISYTQVKDTPNIQEIVRVATQSSKTTSLVELDDVDYSSLTKTNGKYILGGGASTFLALTDTPDTYTGQGTKFVRVNGAETALEFATVAGGGDALTSAPLSQFAATTSLQLKNVISDETGSGLLVFGTSPNITTPTGIVKGDVGLGSVVNADTTTTANILDSLNKRFVTDAQQTVIGNTSGTNTGDNATNTQYSGLAASKENAVTGTTAVDFWSGAKTFVNFATTVRATVLTGLSLVSTTVISATDTVLVALGSLQAQITALTTTVGTKVASVTAGTNVTVTGTATAPIVNTPTMTATVGGAVPTPPNNTTTFLRGDGTFATPTASATITTQDEGGTLSSTVTTLNFTGAGVTASGAGATTTINIPGGSGSGITRSVNVISTPTTAGATAVTDYVYLVSGTTTLTLPTAVSNTNQYTVKRTGTNTVTVATTSAQIIDGSSTASINVQYQSLSFVSDGSNWNII